MWSGVPPTMAAAAEAIAKPLPEEPCWADVPVKPGEPVWAATRSDAQQCCKPAVYLGLCRACYVDIFGHAPPKVKKKANSEA